MMMIIRVGLLLALSICFVYAEMTDVPYQQKVDKESFWKIYTNALRGDKIAQFQTGVMFERGMGVEVNQTQAAKWYEKSAIQGHIDAQYNIGIMYASGRGVEQNEQFAMMWLASAAKQGDEESRKLLNAMIDGKIDKEKERSAVKENGTMIRIKGVRLLAKKGARLCSQPGSQGQCTNIEEIKTYTSGIKSGSSYKITGIATGHGWKPFEGDGWLEASMVEVQ